MLVLTSESVVKYNQIGNQASRVTVMALFGIVTQRL